jgi:hypothetical protein
MEWFFVPQLHHPKVSAFNLKANNLRKLLTHMDWNPCCKTSICHCTVTSAASRVSLCTMLLWLLWWQHSLDSCLSPAPVWWSISLRWSLCVNENSKLSATRHSGCLGVRSGSLVVTYGRLSGVIISYAKICSFVLCRFPFDQRMGFAWIDSCQGQANVWKNNKLKAQNRIRILVGWHSLKLLHDSQQATRITHKHGALVHLNISYLKSLVSRLKTEFLLSNI